VPALGREIASHVAAVEVTGKKEPPVVRLATGEGATGESRVASLRGLILTSWIAAGRLRARLA